MFGQTSSHRKTSTPIVGMGAQGAKQIVAHCSALRHSGEVDEALRIARSSKALFAKSPLLDIFIAETEFARGQFVPAIEAYQAALRNDMRNHRIFTNIGVILDAMGRYDNAAEMYKTALTLAPRDAETLARKARLDLKRCDWSSFDVIAGYVTDFKSLKLTFSPGSFLPLADDPALQKKVSASYVKNNYSIPKRARPKPRERGQGDKIRIGYFSCDFHRHATMHLMIRMLELHDRDRFEIHLFDYTTAEQVPEWQDRIQNVACRHHQIVKMTDGQAAKLAREHGIDIAVDLKGHTQGGRPQILLHQPAPVLVSYLGHPGTFGSKEMDYIVADETVVPAEARRWYSEKIIYMPHCYQVTDNTRTMDAEVPTRQELGLPDDAVVLCSFNSHYKITPREYDIWMRVMTQVENSVLWLWCREEGARARLLKEAEARGVAPSRIYFAESLLQDKHLARLQAADLFLDTFAVCAHTTASDAMWAGLPLVTLEGEQFAARVASSILNAMEMPELVTQTPEAYEALILDLARDPQKLRAVREKLRVKRDTAPLFDTEGFTRAWERQLERALERREQGLKPDHLIP